MSLDVMSVSLVHPVTFSLGEYTDKVTDAVDRLTESQLSRKIWAKEPSLWSGNAEVHPSIKNSLGWLDMPIEMSTMLDEVDAFSAEIKESDITSIVLLGMGGSSLAPEVLSLTYGGSTGFPNLYVLDSTDPDAIARITKQINLEKTLFIVASKSGSTIEPLSLFRHFYALVSKTKGLTVGENFAAITDPGSSLETLAREKEFRRVFLNPSDIGGRYSAISYFGLVPAALAGIEVRRIVESSRSMAKECGPDVECDYNPAFYLGAALAILAGEGRDKVTFFVDDDLKALGPWLEQLIAESTGKEGKGIVPIVDEPLGDISLYGDDRVFVLISRPLVDEHHLEQLHYLEQEGHPIISMCVESLYSLGAEFFRWELATAAAGHVMQLNPFDQPDVESAKALTRALLSSGENKGVRLPKGTVFKGENYRLFFGEGVMEMLPGITANKGPEDALEAFLALLKKGDYANLLAYFDSKDSSVDRILTVIQETIRDSYGAATQLSYGPRYLHSTGQLHKGGGSNGLYFVFIHTRTNAPDSKVPGADYTFLELESSQAIGDLAALQQKRRRVALFNVNTPFNKSLEEVYKTFETAVTRKY